MPTFLATVGCLSGVALHDLPPFGHGLCFLCLLLWRRTSPTRVRCRPHIFGKVLVQTLLQEVGCSVCMRNGARVLKQHAARPTESSSASVSSSSINSIASAERLRFGIEADDDDDDDDIEEDEDEEEADIDEDRSV